MGKSMRFLGFLTSVFMIFAAHNALADYDCPTLRQYTSCNAGYYLYKDGAYNATPTAGNECHECPAGCTCAGDTAAPVCNVTVTLNSNGGSGTPNASTHCSGTTCSCPNGGACSLPSGGLSRPGYTFAGWSTSSSAESGSLSLTFTSDQTVYAAWTTSGTRAIYSCGDGVSGTPPATQTVTYGAEYTLPDTADGCSNPGYALEGWGREPGGTGYWFAGQTITWDFSSDVTFVAQWTERIYNITLNPNGGTINDTYTATYNIKSATITLPTNVERVGYTFAGWYESSDFSGAPVATIPTGSYGDKTFFAKWDACNSTIAGDCGCTSDKYPLNGVCTACAATCAGRTDGYTNGSYNTCNGETAETSCYKNCVSKCVEPDACPANAYNCEYNTGKTFAGMEFLGVPGLCTGPDSACPLQYLTCNANFYQNGGECVRCNTLPGGFNLSLADNYGGSGVCYKNCTRPCDVPECPAHATCTFDTTRVSQGPAFYDAPDVCAAAPISCPMTITSCDAGYKHDTTTNTCVPDVYTITLNDMGGNGGMGTIYQKYTVGYSATNFGPALTIVTVPTRSGFEFIGYFSAPTGGTMYISDTGALPATAEFTANTTLYAQWRVETVLCQAGKYYTGTEMADCPAGSYCPGNGAVDVGTEGCALTCPDGGLSATGATSVTECYKTDIPYTATHGTGVQRCNFNQSGGEYNAGCTGQMITACDGGYYLNGTDTDCIAAGTGWYSPNGDLNRTECPAGGKTTTQTSDDIADCFMENISCPITNGTGEQTCNYDSISNAYSALCTTCMVTGCDTGLSIIENTCSSCPTDYVCQDGKLQTCIEINPDYPRSFPGTMHPASCYRDCELAEHAATMSGADYAGINSTCAIKSCVAGFHLDNGVCVPCPAGYYCDGTIAPNGSDMKACNTLGTGEWSSSPIGAASANECFRKCESYRLDHGMANPVNETENWPTNCTFTGTSDTNHPCDIIGNKCQETSCTSMYEMKNGICTLCDRENALTYKPNGNCIVASCVTGFHPDGTECVENVRECTAAHATAATETWDSRLGAFGKCTVTECEDGYHISANACVTDDQACVVENGIGVQEWNSATKTWGKCVATSCDPGYTNDPYDSNEPTKPCGRCKNMYSTRGEIAASGYITGCEIASCMYQGELYNLEGNECVPICNEYEDETGTMKWDATRKKCVRTCKDGYTMW